ncbi:MAG: hypothetical protein GF418_07170 [Chitinivibrionales bacterium]|nr:hypothetical protein [Chitinivibrionales bacterium]MBD3395392.1 hypothetical protein [Chitinivibrionales bacterium]
MQRIKNLGKNIIDSGGSTVDGNRLYSILLDARASKVSENMFDVAESLLGNEKDGARTALEQLWALKRNMEPENDTGTVDLLIKFYQEKLNVLRAKEENISRISKDSRALLEEKRKRDSEIASVKQEISDCSTEIERLNTKLHKLTVKEQELSLIETQVKKELQTNANEIVNGLYEIILSQQDIDGDLPVAPPVSAGKPEQSRPAPAKSAPAKPDTAGDQGDLPEIIAEEIGGEESAVSDTDVVLLKREETPQPPLFPKSVVKTTRGTVIGEYYYDPKVYKNKRNYVYNGSFLREQLSIAIRSLKQGFDQARYAEAVQMIQDALKRVDGTSLHFEVSTNEMLNPRVLKDLLHAMKTRQYDDALGMCNRLGAKITALGANYRELLREQMARLGGA